MNNTIQSILSWLKRQPTPIKVSSLLAITIAIATLAFSSCSRSIVRFTGTGTLDFEYTGSNMINQSPKSTN